jgi:hypothetical protein
MRVGDLQVEPVVDGDDFLRRGVDAVDRDVEVAVTSTCRRRSTRSATGW